METRREAVKDAVCEYLEHWLEVKANAAYEHACNLADVIFYALGISEAEQDKEPVISLPRRLPVVETDGGRYFLDRRLRQYRNVENPHDAIDF